MPTKPSNYDYLNFIFSSTNFNDEMKPNSLFKSYIELQGKKQVNDITKTVHW